MGQGEYDVGKLKERQDVEGLANVLASSEHLPSRRQAIGALSDLGDPHSVAPLVIALADSDAHVRQDAAAALGRFHTEEAVLGLIDALGDKSTGVRRKAAAALGQIGDRRAVPPLIAALEDKSSWVRRDVAEALSTFDAEEARRAIESLPEEIREGLEMRPRSATNSDPRETPSATVEELDDAEIEMAWRANSFGALTFVDKMKVLTIFPFILLLLSPLFIIQALRGEPSFGRSLRVSVLSLRDWVIDFPNV